MKNARFLIIILRNADIYHGIYNHIINIYNILNCVSVDSHLVAAIMLAKVETFSDALLSKPTIKEQ
jgi:hypothetical protein